MSQLASRRSAPVVPPRSSSRVVKLGWILLVLVLPVAWGYLAVVQFPSDGTAVYASSSFQAEGRWSDSSGVIVNAVYGNDALAALLGEAEASKEDKHLRVRAVDGLPVSDAYRGPAREIGDRLDYTVTVSDRPAQTVQVTLAQYPLLQVAAGNPGAVLLWWGLAFAGCFVFWRRPRDTAARVFLATGGLVPAGMSAFPLGLQAVDFAGGGGVWTYLVGDLANCLVWGSLLLLTLEFPVPIGAFLRRPWLRLAPFAVPFALYGARVAVFEAHWPDRLTRLEGLILPSSTAAVVMTPLMAVVFITRMRQPSMSRENKLAIRVVLTSVLVTALLFVVLGQVPRLAGGGPHVGLWLQPFALFFMLVGAAVAILRYRIYEFDVIVRRSLLLLVAVTAVGLAFLGLAWLLDRVGFAEDRAQVIVGGLLAAALIPLGRWTLRRLNQLVFGARDDSYQVVSELRGVGASVSIDDALTGALTTLSRTLRLGYAAIEVDGAEGDDRIAVSVGEPDRAPTVVELKHHGQPWGRLSLGVSRGREPFGPRDRRLLDDVGSQLGALVASLVMNQDLRRSRERIIAAREEERRRIRRDLHDGLGPALAGQSMQLQFARELLRTDAEKVDPVLERLSGEVRDAIAEIRRLVDDLRPKVLDQLGLVSALQQHAAGSSLSRTGEDESGTVMSWSVSASDVEPLPAAVEVAAYRIVIEAVNNAAKHSFASHCQVDLQRVNGHLAIRISDNGKGLPQKPGAGVGLGSMRERAEELGGTFNISSDTRGTAIAVRLPLSIS